MGAPEEADDEAARSPEAVPAAAARAEVPAGVEGAGDGGARGGPRGGLSVRRVAGALAALAALALVARGGAQWLPALLERLDALGPWAAVGYVALYAGATVAWVPGSLLTLAAGAIFGLAAGTAYTLVGATLGAALAFLVSRHLARPAVERRLGASRRLVAIDEAISREGAKVVFLLRLSPVFPFNALNYALGLTRVRFRDYLLASATGMVPGTFLYIYTGYTAGQVAAAAAGQGRSGAQNALLVLGLAATVLATVLVTRAARRALERDPALSA